MNNAGYRFLSYFGFREAFLNPRRLTMETPMRDEERTMATLHTPVAVETANGNHCPTNTNARPPGGQAVAALRRMILEDNVENTIRHEELDEELRRLSADED